MSVLVETECAHCGLPLRFVVDDRLSYTVDGTMGGADPVLFVPRVDFAQLEDPSIVDAF